ncbi:MAG: hydrogenase maturation protease [Candidatus Heimdallarchaeota archaeon]|nr:MAG: hydrogenase maturation protease [Candidatus Heimdallarchaeota archaeon]
MEEVTEIKILVLGIGNELAGDDIIGITAVREVAKIGPADIDYKQLSTGGLQVLETMLGYDKVLIVDSVETTSPTKRILRLKSEDLNKATFLASPHDINFPTALEIGKKSLPELMPKVIRIIGIEIPIQENISDQVSEETMAKIPIIKKMILEDINYFLKEE